SARPRCGAAGAERDRLAHAAWNEYDACAPSGCLRVRGILLARSPRILRLQTVFRIFGSAHSCRIRVQSMNYATELPGAPDGEYVVLEYETTFERKKKGAERVVMMKEPDGSWRTAGYYVR